jgi:hypothetical protein
MGVPFSFGMTDGFYALGSSVHLRADRRAEELRFYHYSAARRE